MSDEQSTHYFWHNNGFEHIAPLQIHQPAVPRSYRNIVANKHL